MIVYLSNNFLARDFYWYISRLFLIAFAGSYTGKQLLNRIEQTNFRKIALTFVLLIGMITLTGFVRQIIR
jgi:uncharacterized membrane protein YfcA